MEWADDVTAADWWVQRLRPFHDHVVGSMIPSGFDGVTRIFHPIEEENRNKGDAKTFRTWADVAASNGRVAHAEMQLHRIVSTQGENRNFQNVPWVEMGALPPPERRDLAKLLADAGSTGPAWFGFSDIFSNVSCKANAGLPKAGQRSRQYYLIRSTLDAIDEVSMFGSNAWEDWQAQSPNVWWPEDKSWFVISEVDFSWSYVGGSESLLQTIESSSKLEALRSDYSHQGHADADMINKP